MDMRFFGIEMTPSSEPLDDLWNGLPEGFQQRCRRDRNLFRSREAMGRRVEMNISAKVTVPERDVRLADKHVTQPDAKKGSILFDASRSEGRNVERVAD